MKLKAVKEAIRELQAEIALVAGMIEGKSRILEDEAKWLKDLDTVLDNTWDEIERGGIDIDDIDNIDHPDASPLDSTLHERHQLGSPAGRGNARILRRCVDFWLDDIHRRGYGLVHLLLDAVSILDAKDAYAALHAIRYP
jgi:hypothetical protein